AYCLPKEGARLVDAAVVDDDRFGFDAVALKVGCRRVQLCEQMWERILLIVARNDQRYALRPTHAPIVQWSVSICLECRSPARAFAHDAVAIVCSALGCRPKCHFCRYGC